MTSGRAVIGEGEVWSFAAPNLPLTLLSPNAGKLENALGVRGVPGGESLAAQGAYLALFPSTALVGEVIWSSLRVLGPFGIPPRDPKLNIGTDGETGEVNVMSRCNRGGTGIFSVADRPGLFLKPDLGGVIGFPKPMFVWWWLSIPVSDDFVLASLEEDR